MTHFYEQIIDSMSDNEKEALFHFDDQNSAIHSTSLPLCSFAFLRRLTTKAVPRGIKLSPLGVKIRAYIKENKPEIKTNKNTSSTS